MSYLCVTCEEVSMMCGCGRVCVTCEEVTMMCGRVCVCDL